MYSVLLKVKIQKWCVFQHDLRLKVMICTNICLQKHKNYV